MKKALTLAASASLVLSGCATQHGTFESFQAENLNDYVRSGIFIQKTDNLLVINDGSSSMTRIFNNTGYPSKPESSKFAVEKEILSRFNHTIPDIKFNSGLRSFGFGTCLDFGFTKLNKPLEPHATAGFDATLVSMPCASGGSPLYSALDAASHDLKSTTGKTAVLILSDGHAVDGDPVTSAQKLKTQYGPNLCIYTIWVGNPDEASGRQLLQQLSDVAGCGFSTDAASVATPKGMANFTQRVFFDLSAAKPVDACLMDSDGDGVNDCKDKCPGTPKGAKVDATGCWAYRGVLFDTDKWAIKPQFKSALHNAVDVMKNNPGLTVSIEGHTDSRASEQHNQKLSERRASSVKQFISQHGVDGRRMTTRGFGELKPVDSNDTAEGRYNNRRVEINPTNKH